MVASLEIKDYAMSWSHKTLMKIEKKKVVHGLLGTFNIINAQWICAFLL